MAGDDPDFTGDPPVSPVGETALGERRFLTAPGIWRIPVPTGYSSGDVNLYWLDGPDPILVDTGVLGDRSFDLLEAALDQGGRHIRDVRTLLLTHNHVDHAANAWRIREASGCAVHIRQRAVRRLSDFQKAAEADTPGVLAFLARCGFNPATIQRFAGYTRTMQGISHSCPGLEGIDDGDVVTGGGGRRIRVHARPGHSSSDLVYEVEGSGILFTGDHVLPVITPNPTLEGPEPGDASPYRPLPAYRESLRRTEAMECRVACPGHGAPFADLPGRCRTLLALQEKRFDQVHRMLQERGPLSPKDISLALFGKVRSFEVFLTLSEVRGAMDVLEDEGRVTVDRQGPVDRVSAV